MNRRRTVVALIAAVARNGAIGRDNDLLWRDPQDMAHFRRATLGCPVVMGRRTWESIGRPLPGRRMIVLSRDPAYQAPGCTVARSLDEAVELAGAVPEIMVIGGAMLYQKTLPRAARLGQWTGRLSAHCRSACCLYQASA